MSASVDWDDYLRRFHADEAGITEDVLVRSHDGGDDPYDWLLEGVDPRARCLDLGCGSGPARPPDATRWTGVDRSRGELARAAAADRRSLVLGDATRLPILDRTVEVVTCSLSLMLVRPLPEALREIRRVLSPEGGLHLLLPSSGPVRPRDVVRYLPLFWAARSTTQFPPSALRRAAAETLAGAGLEVVSDENRRFELPLSTSEDADRLVRSWYLPGVGQERRDAACRRARAMVPTTVGIPLRRVVARPT